MRNRVLIVSIYILLITFVLAFNLKSWVGPYTALNNPFVPQAQAFAPTFVAPTLLDPYLSKSWVLEDQKNLNIQDAWKLSQGDKRIIVAVIDTGIDLTHPDLKNNLWQNTKEIPGNGIDDDGNGYIDDIHGWNFVANTNRPEDDHGHGTHVAGIIGAVKGNGIGISGICPNVSLMILKYYAQSAPGSDNLKNTIQAFKYAVQNGAHIINYSGGGAEFSSAEHAVIEEARKKGILVIAAAGNERQNADTHAYYPASYDLENIISVAAITQDQNLVDSSNYGPERIDVAAPGHQVYSTLPGGKYGTMTGTSQATAVVTGVAALALSKFGVLPATQIKAVILKNILPVKQLKNRVKTGGIVNADQVLKDLSRTQ
ncbi:MAG: hypothetical protein A3B70_04615 [Deltaproteobacteria bacterium RIFCSPHIGHO2_02_FULL_40_11]|nr:MAG: hypothetical protein A3B70_04615 [Deltaproteobacteria bacterium RIFCSPHIGHO2_02_FULL_40_11]